MSFSLAHTIAQDNTDDASRAAKIVDVYTYFFDTFLPARGWTTTVKNSTSRGAIQPFTDLRTNTTDSFYHWCSWNTSGTYTLNCYEDSTYTTTPGDLMTDTTNLVTLTSITGSALYATSDFKFWTSDEDSSLFFVTQGYKLHLYGCKPKVWVRDAHSGYPASPSTDRDSTHLMMWGNTSCAYTNLPKYLGNNGNEVNLFINQPSKYELSTNPVFVRDFELNDNTSTIGAVDFSDFRYYAPAESARNIAAVNREIDNMSALSLYKYLVNSTDWWVVTGTNVNAEGGLAWYCGTTEPDIS
jgi:hypothetical protein